ncbi:MAG TPA: hypothetical protein VIF82_11765 [Burkholderiaceae bacterium]|jgi:hypothetical protein
MSQLKNTSSMEMSNGIFQVTLIHRFYGKTPSSTDELAQAFNAAEFRKPRMQVQKLDPGSDIRKIRQDWQWQSEKELYRTVFYWSMEVGSLLVALILAYKSTVLYRQRVVAYLMKKESHIKVAGPLLLQVALFVAGVLALGSMMGLFLIELIIPIILMIWISEIIIYVVFRYKYSKKIKEDAQLKG